MNDFLEKVLDVSDIPEWVDKVLVTTFLEINNVQEVTNEFINSFIIDSGDTTYFNNYEIIKPQLSEFSLEELIHSFEYILSPSDRLINGAVYTPKRIRDFIVKSCFSSKPPGDESTIVDWSCGCGGFLLSAAEYLKSNLELDFSQIFEKNLFGVDIDKYSIDRTKILLSLLAICNGEDKSNFSFNLIVKDSLTLNREHFFHHDKFDFVLGNPPFVASRHMNEETKKNLSFWESSKSGHPDLYLLFMELGISTLSDGGVLGYITINTFFKSVNGRALRRLLQNWGFHTRIFDFGGEQVFDERSTYTCLFFLTKEKSDYLFYVNSSSRSLGSHNHFPFIHIPWKELNSLRGWSMKEMDLIKKIENTGQPFGEKFETRNGIATLKNSIYIFTPVKTDDQFYYIDLDTPIEKEICLDAVNSNKFTKISDLDSIRQKLIFPYYFQDNQSRPTALSENQLESKFPKTYSYLTSNKELLATRDKGKGKYEEWFAYGRRQSLEKIGNKLLFPHIAKSTPNFILSSEETLYFYNGMAVVKSEVAELNFLKTLFSSSVFWKYIVLSSKPYESGYYSLARNYIKNFGIPDIPVNDFNALCSNLDQRSIEHEIIKLYQITLDEFSF